MGKIIPLHSLILAIGPSSQNREKLLSKHFKDYEIISSKKICYELVGHRNQYGLYDKIFSEIMRRLEIKLSLGERVVIDAPNLLKEERLLLGNMAIDNGSPLFYLLCDPSSASSQQERQYKAIEKDLIRGDGIADVMNWKMEMSIIDKDLPTIDNLNNKWNGITVIGDIHGMLQSLLSALNWATSRSHYIIFLGDIIDYGIDTLEVANEVYRVVMRGHGEIILGNHERKISRWLGHGDKGYGPVRLSEGNKVTVNSLAKLDIQSQKKWEGRFRGLIARSNHVRTIGNLTLAHAAIHPVYWDYGGFNRDIENFALFGEQVREYGKLKIDPTNGRPVSKFDWVDSIPYNEIVFVGHEIRSDRPMKVVNSEDGQAVFLDTGSGKGGRLSSADLKFSDSGLRIENYNVW